MPPPVDSGREPSKLAMRVRFLLEVLTAPSSNGQDASLSRS